ncbi:rRNA methyltransferase, partial [Thermococci archaeon]
MSSTNIHVILVEPEVEENIGFIARLMKNFSLEKLILLKPKVDIGSKAMVTAMHATDVLSGLEMLGLDLADLRHDYSLIVGTTAKEGGTEDLLRRTIFPWEISKSISEVEDEVALVFGRESTGLTREELEVCDLLIRIPTSENYPSLNLSHAAA